MDIQFFPVAWDEYHTLAYQLAASIFGDKTRMEQIVAISRGGLTFGHLLSDFLHIPIATISIQSYSDIQKQGEVTLTEKCRTLISQKHILLVDDVADTGKTFKRAISYLRHVKPKSITTVSMFYKPHSIYRPDYFAKETKKWILFPYEPTEMILSITKSMGKEGKSKAVIQEFLYKLGYTSRQIRFVRKYHLSD